MSKGVLGDLMNKNEGEGGFVLLFMGILLTKFDMITHGDWKAENKVRKCMMDCGAF